MSYSPWSWYRRTFTVPAGWSGQRIILHLDAVNWQSQVYINGQSLGIHKGGYDPISYDVSPYLNGNANELLVQVYSPQDSGGQPRGKQTLYPGGIMYTSASGIWQPVWLEPVDSSGVQSLTIVPDVDNSRLKLTVNTYATSGVTVSATVLDNGTAIVVTNGNPQTELTIPISNPKLWSPTSPFLYDLKISVVHNGVTNDSVTSYFGMRKISMSQVGGVPKLLLNNQVLFQMGPLDQGFWPDGIYTAPTDAALAYDIQMEKALGFNMVRKHIKVERQRWYYWADKLGIMVWQDMPSVNSYTGNPQPVDGTQFIAEMKAMVTNHWNTPSIVMWVTFNEGQGQTGTGAVGQSNTVYVVQQVENLDPSRLVNEASGWDHFGSGDVLDYHSYPDPGNPKSATQAAVDGEFGGIAWHVSGHLWNTAQAGTGYLMAGSTNEIATLYDGYINEAVNFKSAANGGLNAAVYTEITDVENECNGLMTYDRLMKADMTKINLSNQKAITGALYLTDVFPTSKNAGRTWSYTNNNSGTIPANWYATNFTPTGWSSGLAGFGSGAVPGATMRTTWSTTNIWLRSQFTVGNLKASDIGNLVFNCYHDEDCEIYINGVLAASATGYTTSYALLPMNAAGQAALILNGTNQIAVHCHQTTGGQFIDVGIAIQNMTANFLKVPTDYLGYWPLDATNGVFAVDVSGNGNHGAVSGATWNVGGQINGCLSFNGINNYVQISNVVSSDFSIAFWVKTTQTAGTGQWYYGAGLVDGDVFASVNDFGTVLVGGKFGFGIGNPDTTIVSSNSINDGAWHQCVATRVQASGIMNIYVDGMLQATGTGNANLLTASANLRFGQIASGGGYFNGLLDDVQIFYRALGNNEVTALYSNSLVLPATPVNLRAMTSSSKVILSWNDSAWAASYTVSRSTTKGGPYAVIGTASTASYTDANVVNGITCYYVVSAMNTFGNSAKSSEVGCTPSAVTVAGGLYVDLRASDLVAGTTIWTNRAGTGNFTNTGTGLPVYTTYLGNLAVQLSGNNGYKGPLASPFGGNAPRTIEAWVNNPALSGEETMVAMGRRGNTDYNFAFNFSTDTGWGGLAMFADDMGWGSVPTANAWHHLVVTYDGYAVLLYADGVLKNTAAKTAATPAGPVWVGVQTGDSVTPYGSWFSGYINSVRIHNSVLDSGEVAANYALGPGTATPPAPTGLAGTAGNRQISLTWGAVSGANNYNLWRSTNNGASYQSIATGLVATSFFDANAVSGQTNYYQVAAGNIYGTSTNSPAVGVFLPLPALAMTINAGSLQIDWPGWANGWVLYMATNLSPPVVWWPVTNAPSSNGVFTVTLPAGSGTQFYRLVSP